MMILGRLGAAFVANGSPKQQIRTKLTRRELATPEDWGQAIWFCGSAVGDAAHCVGGAEIDREEFGGDSGPVAG